jgi:hypothetical protein
MEARGEMAELDFRSVCFTSFIAETCEPAVRRPSGPFRSRPSAASALRVRL